MRELQRVPVSYLMAQPSGAIALASGAVDLITCFGVLHHIPNVTAVLRELARVLAPGGVLLLREPTTTMGDWRKPRAGLTAHERGIPRALLLDMLAASGLGVEHAADCYCPPFVRACERLGRPMFKYAALTRVDAWLSRAFAWNYRYHRSAIAQKFAPASLFAIARKPVG